jgi:hypothetical protein
MRKKIATKNANARGELVSAVEVGVTCSAVRSRCATLTLALMAQDVSEIDHEVRAALTEVGNKGADK